MKNEVNKMCGTLSLIGFLNSYINICSSNTSGHGSPSVSSNCLYPHFSVKPSKCSVHLRCADSFRFSLTPQNCEDRHKNRFRTPWIFLFLSHAARYLSIPSGTWPPWQSCRGPHGLRWRPRPWSGTRTPRGSGRAPRRSAPQSAPTCCSSLRLTAKRNTTINRLCRQMRDFYARLDCFTTQASNLGHLSLSVRH